MKEGRLKRVLQEMIKNNLSQMIVTETASVFYLTGKWIHSGERMMTLYINTNGDKKFIVNELFPVNADIGCDILYYNDTENPIDLLSKVVNNNEVLGIDKDFKAHFLIGLIDKKAAKSFVNSSPIIDRIRMIKDSEEITLMREASKINDLVIEKVIEEIRGGVTEKSIFNRLGDLYEENNSSGFSFEPIVAFGQNGANPHYETGKCVLESGMGVLIDTGCIKEYYCSDMTRTVFFKEATKHQEEIYNIVLEANINAIESVKPGARFCDIDRAARSTIEKYGYGKYFTHRTGHSIGIEVHDFGNVSAVNRDELKPGMIFSIEPGIYLANDMGVRIEDLVLVTENGCERLNNYSKELQIVK
ncbi:MAG: Xaa-Pro peptidase family protein [Clostridium perfringens]|nr:Xaa-Pro peptidase family protein [Clostridium perfringens]